MDGVSWGFAVKRNGTFETPLLPVELTHLKQRKESIETGNRDIFWEGELRLRQMFDSFASDDNSGKYLLRHADFDSICRTRRENYAALLKALAAPLRGVQIVFSELPEAAVPSHFCLYAEKRSELQQYLTDHQILSRLSTGQWDRWFIHYRNHQYNTFMTTLYPFPAISASHLLICSMSRRS